MDTDMFWITQPQHYREALRQDYHAQIIDIYDIISTKLCKPVPDYSQFVDNCHFTLDMHYELSKNLIAAIKNFETPGYQLENMNTDLDFQTLRQVFGLSRNFERLMYHRQSQWFKHQSEYGFIRELKPRKALEYIFPTEGLSPADQTSVIQNKKELNMLIKNDRDRMQKWINSPLPTQ